jgi:uncharacterized protein (TIGR02118 family)
MHKLIALYHQPNDRRHFRDHLQNVHLPLVVAFPGLRSLRVAYDVASAAGDSPYFAIVECEFDDQAALNAALTSKEGQAAAADVPNYAGAGVTILTFAPENAL